MLGARIVFACALLFVIVFFGLLYDRVGIDTDLKDLSPVLSQDVGLQSATDILSENIGQRFLLVLASPDEEILQKATRSFETELQAIDNVIIVSDSAFQKNYLSLLTPYRFNFLNEDQKISLKNSSIDLLVSQSQRQLFQLGEGFRLVPFDQDPLAWFSDYIFSSLSAVPSEENLSLAEEELAPLLYQTIPLLIQKDSMSMAFQSALQLTLLNVEQKIKAQYDVTVLRSGVFFFAIDSAQSAKKDIQLISMVSTAGIILLMLLVFRSLMPLLLSFTSIFLGISFAVSVTYLIFGSIHILTIVFGASLIGIVVDYSLHYFYHHLSSVGAVSTRSSHQALNRAMILSVVTSLIGYGALSLSPLLALKKVALFSCCGLAMAWLSVMVLGPWITRRQLHAHGAILNFFLAGINRIIGRNAKVIASGGFIVAALMALFLMLKGFAVSDDPRLFFSPSPDLLEQEKTIASISESFEPGRYLLVKANSTQQAYDTLEAFTARASDNNIMISSLLDWLPSPETQQKNYRLQEKLYSDDGVVEQLLSRLGVDSTVGNTLALDYLSGEDSILLPEVFFNELSSVPPLWFESDNTIYTFILIQKGSDLMTLKTISESFPDVSYINTIAIAQKALQEQRQSGSWLLIAAYMCVAFMLAVYYRRIAAIGLLGIPLVSTISTLFLLSMIGQAITIFHIMALFLVLGLGMDYVIFAKEMREQKAITQQAILLSAITSLLSFGLLALSSMPVVQAFGSTVLIGNTVNLLAAIGLFQGDDANAEIMNKES